MSDAPTPLQLQEFARHPMSEMYVEGYKASAEAHRRIVGLMLSTLQAVLDNPQEAEGLKALLRPEAKMLQRILDESTMLEEMVVAQRTMLAMGGQHHG